MPKRVDWWYVDGEGRLIGYMWPEDFVSLLTAYYGKDWTNAFSAEFDISRASIYRYRNGEVAIPKMVAKCVLMLGTFQQRGLVPEEPVCDWLPGYAPPPTTTSETVMID